MFQKTQVYDHTISQGKAMTLRYINCSHYTEKNLALSIIPLIKLRVRILRVIQSHDIIFADHMITNLYSID